MADEAKAKYEVQVKLDVDASELDSAQQRLAGMSQGSSGGGNNAGAQQMAAVTAAANAASDSIGQVNTQMERVGQTDLGDAANQVTELGESADQATGSFVDLASELEKVGNVGEKLKGVSAGIAAFGADAVQAAGEFEQLRAKLVTIQHDAKTASDTFNYAKTLASSTPFDVKGVVNAAVQLEVYGQRAQELLPVVANLASAMGGDISHAATAMGKALSGSADGLMVLRDSFGINTAKLAKFGAEMNAQGGIAVDSAEKIGKLKQALVDMVNTEFAGGIERQAATVDGALGNLEDEITNAKAAIGDELSPYVSVLSGQIADVVSGLGSMAPFIAVFGTLTAGVTGLAGAFVTTAASVVGLTVAMSKLGSKVETVTNKYKALSAAQKSTLKTAGVAGGIAVGATVALTLAEAIDVINQKRIADGEKLDAQMAAESQQLQDQRSSWTALQKAIESATGAKIDFYKQGDDASDLETISVSDNLPTAQVLDELEKQGVSADQFTAWAEQYAAAIERVNTELEKVNQQLAEAEKQSADFIANSALNPRDQSSRALGIASDLQDLQKRKKALEEEKALNVDRYNGLSALAKRVKDDSDRVDRAQKGALASVAYAGYAERTKDTDLLFTATERLRKSLASLYEAAKGQTLLGDSALKDDATRMSRMADLVSKGQTGGQEYKIISGIQAQAEAYAKAQEALEAGRQERYSAEEQRLDETFAREQAGRDQDLAAERKYYEDKLALHKDYRQALAQTYESELNTRDNGWLPGEKEALQQKYEATQHLSAAEVECINKLHELDKNQAAEKQAQLLASLQSMITPLSEAAQELSSSLFADPDDTVAAYELCIRKLKEWAEAHKEVLAASQEVQSSYTATLKAQEQALKQAIDNRGNKAYQSLQDQAQTQMVSAKGPVQQLNAVRQTVTLLQQSLKTNKDIKASESARYQVQQQIVALGKQELSIKEQIKQMSEQLSNENDSLDLQLKQDELSDLEERSQAGENVYRALIAKEQEIHQMRLADIEEEAQKELESVKGQAELEEQVIKKLASTRQLEENRYQRELRSRKKDEKEKKEQQTAQTRTAQTAASADSSDDSFGWKPGSPLMTMEEALRQHNEYGSKDWESSTEAGKSAIDANTTAFQTSTTAVQESTTASKEHATGIKSVTDAIPGMTTTFNEGLTTSTQALKAFASAVKSGTDALSSQSKDKSGESKEGESGTKSDKAKSKATDTAKSTATATADKAKSTAATTADKAKSTATLEQMIASWRKQGYSDARISQMAYGWKQDEKVRQQKEETERQSKAAWERYNKQWDGFSYDKDANKWISKDYVKQGLVYDNQVGDYVHESQLSANYDKPNGYQSKGDANSSVYTSRYEASTTYGNSQGTITTAIGSGNVTDTGYGIGNELKADSDAVDTHTTSLKSSTDALDESNTALQEQTSSVEATVEMVTTATGAVGENTEQVTASTEALVAFTASLQSASSAGAGGAGSGEGESGEESTSTGGTATATTTASGTAATATPATASATTTATTDATATTADTSSSGTTASATTTTDTSSSGATLQMGSYGAYALSVPATTLTTMSTPDLVGTVDASKTVSNVSTTNTNTTNNYYVDSVRSSQSVDSRALATVVAKMTESDNRRVKTMIGG